MSSGSSVNLRFSAIQTRVTTLSNSSDMQTCGSHAFQAPQRQRASPKMQAAFFSFASHSDLEQALHIPCRWLIEIERSRLQLHPAPFAEARGYQLFALSVTSRSAYHFPIAPVLTRYFRHMEWCDQFIYDCLETCLHEALLNAIVHGNLEIEGGFGQSGQLLEFYRTIEQQLDRPEFGGRRVHIILSRLKERLYLRVSQSVNGYTGKPLKPCNNSTNGRGLEVIRQLSSGMQWHHHGQTIEIFFVGK